MGIAVGNFVDPEFPAPTMEFYVGMRHHWLPPIPSAEQFKTYPAIERGASNRCRGRCLQSQPPPLIGFP